ncbi:hypothetical protein V5O48_009387 [Marasmius crinis-equi]|uniref:Uncharacterized protein n=1 Tax=Marasmius crinis-equi TaxID=585013 RepID=A0ABR3FBA3_9AGAR
MSDSLIHSASSHLRSLRNHRSLREHEENNPNGIWFPPSRLPIERSFDIFTQAAALSFLIALQSPPTRTSPPLSPETLVFISEKCAFLEIPLEVPYEQSNGNVAECHAMLGTCLWKWSRVWDERLPEGASRKKVYFDLVRSIVAYARRRAVKDVAVEITRQGELYPYQEAEWWVVMENDLSESCWTEWAM